MMVRSARADGSGGEAGCGREAMARAIRLIGSVIDGVSPSQTLLEIPARWAFLDRPSECAVPRLCSPRDKGVAPRSPDAAVLAAATDGRLLVFPAGFVLEPRDRRIPCLNVPRSGILSAVFYRDAFHVSLPMERTVVVGTDAVERVDSLFQACFWNPEA